MAHRVRFFAFKQANAKSHPYEDSHYHVLFCHTHAFAVADGASRTIYEDASLSSAIAARTFCRVAALALANGMTLRHAFTAANDEIAEVNEELGITPQTVDYLDRDFLACVGVAGMVSEEDPDIFHYGYIGDCGMLVYDTAGAPVFLSENPAHVLEQFREGWGCANKTDERMLWRRALRNQPKKREMTFGALTGELDAISYLKTGTVRLHPGDTVMLFSDGIYPFIFSREFRVAVDRFLRVNKLNDEQRHERMEYYMASLLPELQKRGAGNLDDDKTFIAFGLD